MWHGLVTATLLACSSTWTPSAGAPVSLVTVPLTTIVEPGVAYLLGPTWSMLTASPEELESAEVALLAAVAPAGAAWPWPFPWGMAEWAVFAGWTAKAGPARATPAAPIPIMAR